MKTPALIASLCIIFSPVSAQICWNEVSQTQDSYQRILRSESGKYLCSASLENAVYESTDGLSWSATPASFPSPVHLAFGQNLAGDVFIASAHHGVYRSNDEGNTWAYANVGGGFGCGALDFEKDLAGNVFVGIGGYLRGLHLSTNGGSTWTNKIAGKDFTDIEVIDASGKVYACNTNLEIWVSENGGQGWNIIANEPFSGSTAMIKDHDDAILIFTTNGSIYQSTDNGSSWQLYSTIPIGGVATPYYNDAIFLNGGVWWAGIYQNGLWRSSDEGLSWERSDDCLIGDFHYLFSENATVFATTSQGIFRYEEVDVPELCSDTEACNYSEVGPCTYPPSGYNCLGYCNHDYNNNGVCDEHEITGCTYSDACNYNALASQDDGSCTFPEIGYNCEGICFLDINNNGVCDYDEIYGCTYPEALNFNPIASIDDNSCIYSCMGDFNQDGTIDTGDLIVFLTLFASQCY
jgi:photosystem II stability/assembly factor-like uncharacterized protein